MRPSARAGWGWLVASLLSLHAIVALGLVRQRWSLREQPPPAPRPPPHATPAPSPTPLPTPDPERYLERVGRLGLFRHEEDAGHHRLSYGFIDHHGRTHDVSCGVDKGSHAREVAWFGYDRRRLNARIDKALALRVGQELEARGLAPYVSISFHDGGAYRWTSQFRGVDDMELLSRLISERASWSAWMDEEFEAERRRIDAAIYKEHGFLLDGTRLGIDYEQVVVRATEALADCFRALEISAAGSNDRQRLGLFLAFFQELRYELPPDRVGGREILGLWVPTEVLVSGRGDCDSKSAAFCALWRNLSARVLLITVPGHALVAVEGKPGPQEKFVRLGNRYFVLCEVAGPAKWHPGRQPLAGDFRYVAIPAASR
jgi:hypothetical protein